MSSGAHRARPVRSTTARRAAETRDAGLDTLARANRWLVAGAVTLAGGASVVTWHAFHVKLAAASAAVTRRSPAVVHRHHGDDGGSGTPAAPASNPAPAPASNPAPAAPAPAVSGGS